jgi:hypothetical protein
VSLLNSGRKLLPGGNRLARRHRPSRFLAGREQVSICEALDRLLNKGAVVVGEATIGLAEIDLIYLQLQLVLSSVETARGDGAGKAQRTEKQTPVASRQSPVRAEQQVPSPLASGVLSAGVREEERRARHTEKDRVGAPLVGALSQGCLAEGHPQGSPQPLHGPLPCLRGEKAAPPPQPPGEPEHSVRPHGNGLAQLILTLVKLLHELMQRQALRRMEAGSLSPAQVEQLGVALMKQFQEIERLRSEFGLEAEDLNLDLGPIGKLF